jgi:SAM-dependent methyltransferase
MFTRSARFYDLIYSWKDYRRETEYLLELIRTRMTAAKSMLDVACGTGEHFRFFEQFERTGIDLDSQLLAVARNKLPTVEFVEADMTAFSLGRQFDVVICLFSAIGYAVTIEKLNAAVLCMAEHSAPEGLLIVEPWFTPDQWMPGKASLHTGEDGDLKVSRIFASGQEGKVSANTVHYLVAEGDKVEYFTESHRLGLFTEEEMRMAFERAGLDVEFDPVGLGRGLYIGRKSTL